MIQIRSIIQYVSFLALLSGSLLFGVEAWFQTSEGEGDENTAAAIVTIEYSEASSSNVGYTIWPTSTASNTGYTDFNLESGTIAPDDETTVTLDLQVVLDYRYEADEEIVIVLGQVGSVTVDDDRKTFTWTILNDDEVPKISFSSPTDTDWEGNSEAIYIELDNEAGSYPYVVGLPVTIDWAITNGTTGDGDHNVVFSGNYTINEGSSSTYFWYDSFEDQVDENNETLTITIGGTTLTNCALGSQPTLTYTIIDDDDPPEVYFNGNLAPSQDEGSNDGDNFEYEVIVQLSDESGIDGISVGYEIVTGETTFDGDDYNNVSGDLIFPAGDDTESFTFNVVQDVLNEPDETITFQLISPTNLTIHDSKFKKTYTFENDDEQPEVSIAADAGNNEEVVAPTITVSLDTESGRDISVTYSDVTAASGGTATPDVDYTAFTDAQTLTIAAGSTEGTFNLSIVDDEIYEANETIMYTISGADFATLGSSLTQTYSINNDPAQDTKPTCGFVLDSSPVTETNGDITHDVIVELSAVSGMDVTFNYSVTGGTASGSGVDYTFAADEVTIAAGTDPPRATLAVMINGDEIYENSETIEITLDPDGGGITNATTATALHTVTINENDDPPAVGFTETEGSVLEGSTASDITFEIDAVSGLPVVITYSTSDDVAEAGSDYTALTAQTATIAVGQTQKTISLVTTHDLIDEADETLLITISSATNSGIDSEKQVQTFSIEDNDNPPNVGFEADNATVSEATTAGSITVKVADPGSGLTITVPYSVTGGTATAGAEDDYTFTDGELTFAPGDQTETISFLVNNDVNDEEDQTIVVELNTTTWENASATGSYYQTYTYTIQDNDDPPALSFTTTSENVYESAALDGNPHKVGISLTPKSEKTVNFSLVDLYGQDGAGTATQTDDYSITTGAQTFAAGETSMEIDLTLVNGDADEETETVNLKLTYSGDNATLSEDSPDDDNYTLNILDSDAIPTVTVSATDGAVTVEENEGAHNMQIELNYTSYQDVVVGYSVSGSSTATATDDYTIGGGGTVTIPALSTTGEVNITIAGDAVNEYDETIIIALAANTNCTVGSPGTLTLTIGDNSDIPDVGFASSNSAENESGTTRSIVVNLGDGENTKSGKEITIPYTFENSSTTANTGAAKDHDLEEGNITIPVGSSTGTISIVFPQDLIYEDPEDLVIQLGTPVDGDDGEPTASIDGDANQHTFTVTSLDDPPSVKFSSENGSLTEDDDEDPELLTLAVELSGNTTEEDVKFYYSGTDGTAGSDDYTVTEAELTIDAGIRTGEIPVTLKADKIDEDPETFTVTILGSNLTDVTRTAPFTQTVTITDNDDPPLVNIDTDNSTGAINEQDGSASIKFVLQDSDGESIESAKEVSVGYIINTDASTATLDQDYSDLAASGAVTFDIGETEKIFTIPIINDLVDEAAQIIVLDLQGQTDDPDNFENATLGTVTSHTVTINDNDPAPVVFFKNVSPTDANEGSSGETEVSLTLKLTRESEQTITIPFTINTDDDLAATENEDFEMVTTSPITIAGGENTTETSITFNVTGDSKDEYDQTITFDIGDGGGNVSIASEDDDYDEGTYPFTWEYTITDDDAAPTVSISSEASGVESADQDVTVTLSAESEKVIVVAFEVADGTTTRYVDGTSYDPTDGATEYDDYPKADFKFGDVVSLLDPGETEETHTVEGLDDNIYEGDETFTITITAHDYAVTADINEADHVTVATGTATVTLTSDDPKPNVGFLNTGFQQSEAVANVTLQVKQDRESGYDTEIEYSISDNSTATNPDDYNIFGDNTLTIEANAAEYDALEGYWVGEISFTLVDDLLAETDEDGNYEDETIIFDIDDLGDHASANAYQTATITINDDDTPPETVTISAITTASETDGKAVSGYWNSYNNAFSITVPIDPDQDEQVKLTGGTLQLMAANTDDNEFTTLGDAVLIVYEALPADAMTLTISGTVFEAHDSFEEGNTIAIKTRITDQYGNYTDTEISETTLIIDQIATTRQTVGTIIAADEEIVAGYLNGTNTILNVTVPLLSSDATLLGGTIQIQAKVTESNDLASVGALYTIVGPDITDGAVVPVVKADVIGYESLTDYESGNTLYHNALVTDVAGNDVLFILSETEILIDIDNPYYASATSSANDGIYKAGDAIPFTVSFDDEVTASADNSWTLTLNSGSSITGQFGTDAMTSYTFDPSVDGYTVQEGDEADALNVTSIVLDFGSIKDAAGNSVAVEVIAVGNNFVGREIIVDGIYPVEFTLDVVTPVGGTVTAGYWNESNTSATIPITLADDASLLDGGSIQITGTIGDQTSNIGSAYTILADDLNTEVTMTVDGADIEAITDFAEDASIIFSAVVTDKAGNERSGTVGDAILVIDEFKPVDLGIESILARDDGSGTIIIVPGYLNTTNEFFLVDVSFDGTDNSLYDAESAEGGSIVVLARPVGEATFVTIADAASITSSNADDNIKQFVIEQSKLLDANGDLQYDPGFENVDTENVKVEFRAQVTDLAGNMTEQATSEHTVQVDKILVTEVVLSYEPVFVNETAVCTVTATIPEPTHGWNNTDEDDEEAEQELEDKLYINIDYAGALTDDIVDPMVPLGLEEFTDEDDDGVWDDGELFTDLDSDGVWDAGDSTVWTYIFDIPDDEDNAGSPVFWVVGTDRAGNPITGITGDPLTEVQENTTGLVIDIVDPEITFTYENTSTDNNPINIGKGGEVINVTATWVETNLADDNIPQVTATFSDLTTDVQDNTGFESATVWNYQFTLPEDLASDGSITFSSSGSDAAQNSDFTYVDNTVFILDNTAPVISDVSPGANSYEKEGGMQLGYTLTEAYGSIESGTVQFEAILGAGGSFTVNLEGDDLQSGTRESITNQDEITAGIVDGTVYNIVFTTVDFAGNTGTNTVEDVIYDTAAPYASLSFSQPYASGDMLVTVTATFSEGMASIDNEDPVLDTIPNIVLYFGEYDDVAEEYNSSTQSAMTATENNAVWTHEFSVPTEMTNDGIVHAEFDANVTMDIAGNLLVTHPGAAEGESVVYSDTLIVDNLVPQAEFIFLDMASAVDGNEDGDYEDVDVDTPPDTIYFGNGGQNITILVEMNEPLKRTPTPMLSYQYNYGATYGGYPVGDFTSNVSPTSSTADSSKWYYNIVLADDDVNNDGPFHAVFTAQDRSGNAVDNFVGADTFSVDNIHPDAFETGTVVTLGEIVVEGWFNGNTDSIEVEIPIPLATVDSTLYNGGIVDIQLFNITRGTQWITIPSEVFVDGDDNGVYNEGDEFTDANENGVYDAADAIVNPGDAESFYRSFASILWMLPDGTDMVLGDQIKVRAKLTDKNGNETFGTESTSQFVYDPTAPVVGTANGGNFVLLDTLISSDILTVQWTEFEDYGDPENNSGTDRYELAIENIIDPADSLNNMHGWETVALPSEPYELVLALMHNESYAAHVRAIDVAGNISEILHADTLLRYNSNPVVSQLSQITIYEDIEWNNVESVTVSDLDLNTVQDDSFTYEITTTRIIGEPATTNVATIDSLGSMSWVPTQDDTGSYEMAVVATDAYTFTDTMTFPLTVVAVNDTPSLAILQPDDDLEWIEDQTEIVKINLTKHVADVDHSITTEMTWQAVVLDTTELDEDFPLGQVIVGPGTNRKVHAKLTREYLGFNPNTMNIKASAISPRTINYLNNSRSNPLLTVTIDTASADDSTWAIFNSDLNYHGADHRIIFIVQDPDGAETRDTIKATVLPENDPPIISELPLVEVIENDSIRLEFGSYATDVDDTSLTFTVSAITNEENITISPASFVSHNTGDSVLFIPQELWSNEAMIKVVVADEEAKDSSIFTLDVLRVPRPHLSVAVVQNNAFNQFLQVVVTDTVSKTVSISLDIQNEGIALDTIAAYTYSGDFSFANSGTYSIDVLAFGIVGDTTISEAFALAAGRAATRWYGSSDDGRFSIVGEPGAVSYDQPFLIVDSTLFAHDFNDQASYVLGDENFTFGKPIEVRFGSQREDLAIYRRKNGVTWEELPSLTIEGEIFTLSTQSGYFKLGPKTIIVPEETNIHQNYPNPFNPTTTIMYDIGLMDGLSQNLSIHIYNLLGQHVRALVENKDQIGQFKVQWNGRDKFGQQMASGVYFIQLTTQTGIVKNKKMMLLK